MFHNLTPAVRAIFMLNVAGFVLQLLMPGQMETWFALYALQAHALYGAPSAEPWQIVTYAFLHGGLAHLAMNMLALLMLAPDLERIMGGRRFTVFYLVSVVSAALVQLAWYSFAGPTPDPTVGASGGIFGLLLAYGMAFPQRELMIIFLPIPIKAWLFVLLYGAAELLMGVTNALPGVAHFAHLGGMLGGWLLILYWRRQAANPRRWR
jgi:membrane associated rhomboid family serine protease